MCGGSGGEGVGVRGVGCWLWVWVCEGEVRGDLVERLYVHVSLSLTVQA